MPRIAATPVATLADLRRVTPWLWVICARCLRRTPTALAQWIIRWGPDSSSDMLRRCAWRDEVRDLASEPDKMALLPEVWRRLHERD